MSVELGHFSLILACAIGLVQAIAVFALWRRNPAVVGFARQASILQFLLVVLAFVTLIQAFATSDFSVALVFENSHTQQPLLYKITSVWGNHEGSLLLWILILVLFGASVAWRGTHLPDDLLALVLATQGLLVAAFGGFTIFTSNPFARLADAPFEGRDLNPVLQDIGLAIHPPLLYVGYVGFSVCFSFAIAALVTGRIDSAWARWVRPWTIGSWAFLTLGIAMGSYWAYYELGWGGWWFWDPVENASFMPWLAGTALLHSALVMEKRNALKVWTIFLAIITFSLSLLGTFLVRSGVLTSVHSFASDPTRGLVILGLLAAFIGGAFILFALRASSLRQGGLFAPISREGALVFNNLFLATATAAVLTGTLYPLVLDAVTGNRISVGAPFFNITFGALMVPVLLAMPFGPFLPWKRADLAAVSQRLLTALLLAVFAALVLFWVTGRHVSLAPLGFLLAFWVIFGAIADLIDRIRLFRIPLRQSWNRLVGLPLGTWATAIAHAGLGITVVGIVSSSAWQGENITTMSLGDTAEIAGYQVVLDDTVMLPGPNFDAERAIFHVTGENGAQRSFNSERRIYRASGQPTTEAGILTYGFSQLYVAIGEETDTGLVVRIWFKPLITLIWLGCIVMAAAGFISLADKRSRIGIPAPARKRAEAAK